MNLAARLFYGIGDMCAGAFNAGQSSRFRQDLGWGRATPRDEDRASDPSERSLLRQKSADLRRNSPVVAGVCDRLALFTVGAAGIQPQAQTSDPGWNRAAEQWWKDWGRQCDSRGRLSLWALQWMAVSLRPTHGGLYLEKLADGTTRPIECERIQNPADARLAAGYTDGVKVDSASGRIVAYRTHTRAKDGSFSQPHSELDVPAESMINVTRAPWRPDQVREIPDLAAVIPALTDIDELNRYVLNTHKAQSMPVAFLKKEGGGPPGPRNGEPTVGQRQTFKFDWGEILHGKPGESAEMLSSNTPQANHIPFVKMHYAICSAALGFPYEFLTLDLSGLDFSRQKGLLLLVNYACRPWKQWLAERMLQPLWNWRIAMEMGPGGDLSPAPAPDGVSEWCNVEWQPPEEPWIDRQEANQADMLAIQMGLDTAGAAAKRRGGNLEDIRRARAKEIVLTREIAVEEGVEPEQLEKLQIPGQTEKPAAPAPATDPMMPAHDDMEGDPDGNDD